MEDGCRVWGPHVLPLRTQETYFCDQDSSCTCQHSEEGEASDYLLGVVTSG
jgi:hypothetical protein